MEPSFVSNGYTFMKISLTQGLLSIWFSIKPMELAAMRRLSGALSSQSSLAHYYVLLGTRLAFNLQSSGSSQANLTSGRRSNGQPWRSTPLKIRKL